jgi:hypothetical protein
VLEWLGHLLSRSSDSASQRHSLLKTAAAVDLREYPELTHRLLDDTRAWRERVVHQFTVGDVDHVQASMSYQVRLPADVVTPFASRAKTGDEVRLLLPLTIRQKELLLGLHFSAPPQGHCTLLLREQIANLQAGYVARLLARGSGEAPQLEAVWYGVSAFTADSWRHHLALQRRPWRRRHSQMVRALVQYLNADLGLGISPDDVRRWLAALAPAKQLLIAALEEGEGNDSPAELLLLGIPFMPFRPTSPSAIDQIIDDFVRCVHRMTEDERSVIAEYGRRWEVIVDTVVPVEQPVTIKLSDQRPWIDSPSPIMEQAIPFGDARTVHVEIRAADRAVVLSAPALLDLGGARVDLSADAIRKAQDVVSIYASQPDRPYFVRIRTRARVRLSHRMMIWWLLVLVALAGGVAVALPDASDLVGSLTLLTFPLTLAGAVVLTREASGLADRLLLRWRVCLAFAIAALWVVTLGKLTLNTDERWAEDAWKWVKTLVEGGLSNVGL